MSFTNYDDYKNKREELLNKAQSLLDNGEIGGEYSDIKNQIEALDSDFETFRKERANLNSLSNTIKPNINFMNIKGNTNNMDNINKNSEEIYNSIEYREAFMKHVVNGVEIPIEFKNSNETSKTSDVGVLIPNNVMQRIIEKMESFGMILPLVTRTSYKGGLTIPTSSVKPIASWVSEGQGSNTQKKTTGSITFAYHKLRCAIAISLEVETMAIASFETAFINNVSEAMVIALEQAIINGDGAGKPKGILSEEVDENKKIEIEAEANVNYNTLIEAEASLGLAYESRAVWFMHKATFMAFYGIVDDNGQPIARTNYGINGIPERTLLGRKVILNEYMTSIKSQISKDEVVAFLFNPSDYVLNTNLNLTIKKYEDNDSDDTITKAVMLVDGKVVDKNSLVKIIKKHT